MLVNSNEMPMPFVVDLAALASRRGYLKLDKWLHDRMRDQQVSDLCCCSFVSYSVILVVPPNLKCFIENCVAIPCDEEYIFLLCPIM